MAYREYSDRIGGINHWLFAQKEFNHLISRSFRDENYSKVINGSGLIKDQQKYPKGYQEMIIPELKKRADFFKEIPALKDINPASSRVLTVLVGDKDDPKVAASRSYVGMKSATTKLSGLSSMVEEFPSTISQSELYEKLNKWNNDNSISILMFQLPFGGKAGEIIDTTMLCNRINITKDGDGLNQVTLGLMSLGADRYFDCCTPSGMLDLASVFLVRERGSRLRPDGIASFAGLEVLVAGRSEIVGEPLFNILKRFDATTLGPLHTKSGSGGKADKETQLKIYTELSKRADIIFSCMGFHPYNIHTGTEYFFTSDMIKEECLIIDASTSFRKDGQKPYGDFDPSTRAKAAAYTLETGGVGPATVTRLVHQGWRGMLYQNIDKVRKALINNKSSVISTFTGLLASYAKASEADAKDNALKLYERAINHDSHPVHAVDALEAVFPRLMEY
ncbi:bifunctional 5,10-methylenetetrahydrofolate dehydrogenase/5,10-methenyltetrahydrofolate cyclohydrolase [Candidatus Desantisbacteria bacterium]|nr:bifunctional 5,10-methylenetetrahydrofolate dehydrogenase/5,10-methenyltetrahydrofolate cyclohydrolase [Candidatus Desantisbacteria bacterium]